jgi:hypothetical protein
MRSLQLHTVMPLYGFSKGTLGTVVNRDLVLAPACQHNCIYLFVLLSQKASVRSYDFRLFARDWKDLSLVSRLVGFCIIF